MSEILIFLCTNEKLKWIKEVKCVASKAELHAILFISKKKQSRNTAPTAINTIRNMV